MVDSVVVTNPNVLVTFAVAWQGNYDSSKSYTAGQGVYYQSSSYVAIGYVPAGNVPSATSSYWQVVAAAGLQAGSSSVTLSGSTYPIVQASAAKTPGASVSVTNVSSQIIGANITNTPSGNTGRAQLVITNPSGYEVWISLGGTASVGSGVRLAPNGGQWQTQVYQGSVSAITAGSGATLAYSEV